MAGTALQHRHRSTTGLLLLLFLTLLFALPACERRDRSSPPDDQSDEGIQTRSTILPENPERIVSMAPNLTELLFAFDRGSELVGVTRYCDWPPEAASIPKIGGMLDPDYEALLATEPDLVLGVPAGADHKVVRLLEGADIAFAFLEMDDLAGILRGIHELGEILGEKDKARQIAAQLQEDLQTHSRAIRKRFDQTGTTVLLVYDQEPIVAAGRGTFGDELITLAGLDNAVDDRAGAYPLLDIEQVLSLNPTIILDVSIGPQTSEVLAFWNRFPALDAVAHSRVFHIDDPVMMRPGPRLPEALRQIGEALEDL